MTNNELRKAWNAMDGETMHSKIERACREVIRQRPNMAKTACVCAAELAGEAWIRIDTKLSKGAEAESVDKLVIVAATEALTAAARFNQHSAGGTMDGAGDDANSTSQADSIGEKLEAREEISSGIKRPVENSVINAVAINAAAADARDKKILAGIKHGLSNNEIAAKLGISAAAVTQRKNKIADRIIKELDAEAEEASFNCAVSKAQQERNSKAREAEHYKAAQLRHKNK